MTLKLRYYGDPALRQKAEPVKEITDEIRKFCDDMIKTMLAYNGCGLAATQVGVMWRIFVSNVDYEDEQGNVHYCEPVVYINPIVSNPSEILVERNEACLSLPDFYAPVIRPHTVTIEATDVRGKQFKKECHLYKARNMMHENDHLNGVLFIDRIKGKKRKEIEPALRKIKEKYS